MFREGKGVKESEEEQKKRWLEENTFWCEKLQARITEKQCRINRERPNYVKGVMIGKEKKIKPLRPKACQNCQRRKA